jgi:hypothetical protein
VLNVQGGLQLEPLKHTLETHGHENLPVILEVFYPFEASDEFVLRDVKSSVRQMRAVWAR